jgi:FAD:protein FMN transferase
MSATENIRAIDAFGGTATIYAGGSDTGEAVNEAAKVITAVHDTLTRFEPGSELCQLNADPRPTVPVSPIMFRFLESVRFAGRLSEGLVDAGCLDAVERSGYTRSLSGNAVRHPGREPAVAVTEPVVADAAGTWADFVLDPHAGTVTRPPGLRLDAGGIGKGLAADMAAEKLSMLDTFAVECLGELRFGGTSGVSRPVDVASPDPTRGPIAELREAAGAIATSGTTKRSWVGRDGRPSHHLIDPRIGEPVYSGVIQVTALADSALEAEVRAKSALISGPSEAAAWLPDGGVIVLDDMSVRILAPFTSPGAGL